MTTQKRTIRRPQPIEESKMQGYFMISRRSAAIAVTNKLTGSQCRLWLYLMLIDPFADYTALGEVKYHDLPSIAEIAIAVGSSPDTVEKDLRRLRKLGLYEYRTVTIQGHNSTAANARAEAERLKPKQKSSRKPKSCKDSAYLSSDGDYLSPNGDYLSSDGDYLSPNGDYLSGNREPEPLPNKDSSVSSDQSDYSDFIKSLSEEERANFLKFCQEKTKNLSQEINDIEAWLASRTRAGQNRWEVYYEKYVAQKRKHSEINLSCNTAQSTFQQWQSEIEQQRLEIQKRYQELSLSSDCTQQTSGGEP